MLKFLFLCLVAFVISSVQAKEDGRIVGGQIVNVTRVSFIVQLKKDGWCFCGGTLVNPTTVVTAAHCVSNGIQGVSVSANANTRSDKGIEIPVIKYKIPVDYSLQGSLNKDIAVLKLARAMPRSVMTMPLSNKPWPAGEYMDVLGWGLTKDRGYVSQNLRTVKLLMIPHKDCLQKNFFSSVNSDTKECAMGAGKDSCQGDSGGPAIYQNTLVGVVSSGIACADPRYPGIYTSVYTMRQWLDSTIKTI